MTYLTFQPFPSKSVGSPVSRESMWSRIARAYSLWRKQARDRADLAPMGYRDLQDIGCPMSEGPFPQIQLFPQIHPFPQIYKGP